MREPPQMWPPPRCRLTCHGQLPGCASEPPTMRSEGSGRPQSAMACSRGHHPPGVPTPEAQVTQDKIPPRTLLRFAPLNKEQRGPRHL